MVYTINKLWAITVITLPSTLLYFFYFAWLEKLHIKVLIKIRSAIVQQMDT